MTTITTDRARLEELLGEYWEIAFEESSGAATGNKANRVLHEIRALFYALAAPAAAPDQAFVCTLGCTTECLARQHGVPSECPSLPRQPATAPSQPAWHGAPTCDGLWLCDEGDENPYRFTCHKILMPLSPYLSGEGERWFGPIPPDGDKP